MIEFIDNPKLEVVGDSSFIVTEDWQVKVDDFTITVHSGFYTDLASVPRLPIVYLAVGGTGHKAAILHDYLYVYKPCSRKQADEIFRDALIASGVSKWHAQAMYWGVRIGGGSYWNKK